MVKGDVAALQLLDVAHHFRFRTARREDGVRQIRSAARQSGGELRFTQGKSDRSRPLRRCQSIDQGLGIGRVHHFIRRNQNSIGAEAHVDLGSLSGLLHGGLERGISFEVQGVKELAV